MCGLAESYYLQYFTCNILRACRQISDVWVRRWGPTAPSAPALDTSERGEISPVPDDDIEARVTSLEQEVARFREQIALTSSDATAARAAAARVLVAGADRDISEVRTELRAHTQTLNALREIQLEQGQQMRESFVSQERRIGELAREMQGGFATMATGMAHITALLTEIRDPSATAN